MFCVKHTICTAAAGVGGVLGFVATPANFNALVAAFIGMFFCALVADILTAFLERNEG